MLMVMMEFYDFASNVCVCAIEGLLTDGHSTQTYIPFNCWVPLSNAAFEEALRTFTNTETCSWTHMCQTATNVKLPPKEGATFLSRTHKQAVRQMTGLAGG